MAKRRRITRKANSPKSKYKQAYSALRSLSSHYHPHPHEYGLNGTQAAKLRRAVAKELAK